MSKKKGCLIAIAAVAALFIAMLIAFPIYRHIARQTWKNRSIAEIHALTELPHMVDQEISKIKSAPQADAAENSILADGWLSCNIMLMKNGEWLAYRYSNSHESPMISDHFIAKGSNGKWYYTSNHFCKGMLCLLQDMDSNQPPSISFFIRAYHLNEFDGKSGKCLNETLFAPDQNVLQELNQKQ